MKRFLILALTLAAMPFADAREELHAKREPAADPLLDAKAIYADKRPDTFLVDPQLLLSISEREHRRLGHDLHDGICQELAGIHFAVEAIMKQVPKDSPVRRQLKSIAEAVHRATHHTRLLSRGLAPIELENGNLIFALEELAADIQSLFQIDCVLESHAGASTFDPHICSNLYRIAQEAVQNAIKHGKASKIRIGLDCRKSEGFLTITDNGNGIHSRSDAEGNGMGLTIMKHRAELIRGSVKLLSHDGGGTLVHCFFRL